MARQTHAETARDVRSSLQRGDLGAAIEHLRRWVARNEPSFADHGDILSNEVSALAGELANLTRHARSHGTTGEAHAARQALVERVLAFLRAHVDPGTPEGSAVPFIAAADLLQFRNNRDNFDELVTAIRSGVRLRPFVGAGLSIPCGYPGWGAFLIAEARHLEIEPEITAACDAGRFEEAANRIEAELGPNGLHRRVRQVFGNEQAPKGAVMLLPRIAQGSVITTNFDSVIEDVFFAARRRIKPVWGTRFAVLSEALFTQEPYLLKIHGDAVDESDRVLTSDEYNRHYGPDPGPWTTPLPTALGRIFASSVLLFLGCSLLGDRTMRVLEHAVAATPGMPTHHAIVESPSDDAEFRARMRWLLERRIAPIWYPKGKHDAVETLLRALIDAVEC